MRLTILALVCFVALLSAGASGDEIVFKNGDRVTGKITKFLGDKLKVTGEKVGAVKIALNEVVTFSTEEALEIHFKDGTVFKKKVGAAQEGMITVEGPNGQPLTMKIADIEKINPPKVAWKGNVTAGIVVTRGNSHTQNANMSAEAVRKGETDRITAKAGYSSSRQEDSDTGVVSTTQRSAYLGLQYDLFFTDEVYGYANARAERDAIAGMDLRFIGGFGAGWQIYEEEDFNLNAESGISWVSENYLPPRGNAFVFIPETEDDEYFAGRVAYHVDKNFNSAVSFFHNTEYIPGLEKGTGAYVKTDAGIRSSLTDSMFAELKALWSWDSTPAEDKERLDVTYIFSLGWNF